MRQRYNKFSKNEKTKCGFMRCTHVISCNTHVRIMRARWTKQDKTGQAPGAFACQIPASKVKREGKKGLFCWRKGKSRTGNVPHWDWKKTKNDKGERCTWVRSALRRSSQHTASAIAAQCIFCPIFLPDSAQRFSRSNLVGASTGRPKSASPSSPFRVSIQTTCLVEGHSSCTSPTFLPEIQENDSQECFPQSGFTPKTHPKTKQKHE